MQKTLRSVKASPFGRGVTVGDGEGKDVTKNKQTQRYEDFWLELSYRRQRGICPRACPLRRLRASSPKGRALGKTENIHSDTFPALTVVRYLKRGRVYQNSHLSGCAPADQFCAGSAVPAGGGTGNPVLGRMRDHRPFFVAQCSTNSPRRANMWSMGPEPLPRSSMADRQPEIYALARSTAASRG